MRLEVGEYRGGAFPRHLLDGSPGPEEGEIEVLVHDALERILSVRGQDEVHEDVSAHIDAAGGGNADS